ncbi:ABC transporter substrate-binding protein [Nitriliruptor alkaliphilus]|uniref:ABC transporter substrate-binding protein n=1 Tax=Nitriliruptor alkaliphilus TaxID=427918 RepID=UPI0006985AA2|nr:ABC transporter substrate-binding protein [Nitriliruptor alkaliphilus]
MKLRMRSLAGAMAMGLVLMGCSVSVQEAGPDQAVGGGAAAEAENTGRVSIAGAATGADGAAIQTIIDEAVNAEADFVATYTGSDSFEQNIVIQIEAGTPPDIGFYPQPGAVLEQAAQGNIIALDDLGFDITELEARFGSYMMSLGAYEGRYYGMPDTLNFKSAIWYSPPAFEEAGYAIPGTWDELLALSDQIVADGKSPWCIGTGSEAATGWPATDWLEDIVLRQAGTDVYDAWVTGDQPFDSPEIRAAFETFGDVIFTEGYVFGGHENIASTDFRDAPDPMFRDDPPCYLHRQATFIPSFFPEGLTPIEDYDFFPFPPIDGQEGVLMAGGMSVVFNNRPEVRDFLDRYTHADVQCRFGSTGTGSSISANFTVDPDCYENPLTQQAAATLSTALQDEVARFDASDLMPPAVGSGEFWNGMNTYTNTGPDSLDTLLPAIDAAFP